MGLNTKDKDKDKWGFIPKQQGGGQQMEEH